MSKFYQGKGAKLPFAQQHSLHHQFQVAHHELIQNLNERPATMLHAKHSGQKASTHLQELRAHRLCAANDRF